MSFASFSLAEQRLGASGFGATAFPELRLHGTSFRTLQLSLLTPGTPLVCRRRPVTLVHTSLCGTSVPGSVPGSGPEKSLASGSLLRPLHVSGGGCCGCFLAVDDTPREDCSFFVGGDQVALSYFLLSLDVFSRMPLPDGLLAVEPNEVVTCRPDQASAQAGPFVFEVVTSFGLRVGFLPFTGALPLPAYDAVLAGASESLLDGFRGFARVQLVGPRLDAGPVLSDAAEKLSSSRLTRHRNALARALNDEGWLYDHICLAEPTAPEASIINARFFDDGTLAPFACCGFHPVPSFPKDPRWPVLAPEALSSVQAGDSKLLPSRPYPHASL